MGFTTEAISNDATLLTSGQNRAWDVWDKPPATLPETVTALSLIFPTCELAIRPEQRDKTWRDTVYVEAAPKGKLTIFTLFISQGEVALKHKTEPSFCVASLDIGDGKHAQLVAHGEDEGEWPKLISEAVEQALAQVDAVRQGPMPDAYGYFFGYKSDGSCFIVGASAGY